jgi:MFS family permease
LRSCCLRWPGAWSATASASSYPVAVAARFLAGFLSGNLGTTKTYLSEELHRAHLARGLRALGFSAGFGGIVGPVVGGYLNRPAVQYPDSFSSSSLFGQFPYLLPEMLSIAIGLGGFIVSLCYLPESAAFTERQQIIAAQSRASSSSAAADVEMSARPQHQHPHTVAVSHQHQSSMSDSELRPETILTVLHRKQVVVCTGLYGLMALTFIIYDEMFSFFFEAEVSAQGLGYSSARTGSFLAVTGVCLILFQILVFPPLVERVGVIRLYRLTTLLCVPYFFFFPLLSNVSNSEAVSDWLTVLIISAACCVRAAIGACCFTPVFMLINGSAPQASLGAVNGLGQSLAALSRTVGPLVGGGVWAASLAWGDWHHMVVYSIAAALAALTYVVSLSLRKKVNEDDPDEEEDVALGSKERPSRPLVMME